MKKLFIFTTLFLFYFSNSFSDNIHFIDYTQVLNKSKAGAEVQDKLKKKIKSEFEKFKEQQTSLRKEENEIISKKKILSKEEYQKLVIKLRKKVADIEKNKKTSFNNIGKTRSDAKITLLKVVNPIIKKYMEVNNIGLVLDKKSIILGDTKLEITDQIITALNKQLTSIKIN